MMEQNFRHTKTKYMGDCDRTNTVGTGLPVKGCRVFWCCSWSGWTTIFLSVFCLLLHTLQLFIFSFTNPPHSPPGFGNRYVETHEFAGRSQDDGGNQEGDKFWSAAAWSLYGSYTGRMIFFFFFFLLPLWFWLFNNVIKHRSFMVIQGCYKNQKYGGKKSRLQISISWPAGH